MHTQYNAINTTWSDNKSVLSQLRHKVNVLELRTPESIEFDEKDNSAFHVIIKDNDIAVACGRLTRTGVISRICVLPSHRGLGIGAEILKGLVELARANAMEEVNISSKLDTVDFYTQYGFKPHGNVFMHAGLPRQHVISAIGNIHFD